MSTAHNNKHPRKSVNCCAALNKPHRNKFACDSPSLNLQESQNSHATIILVSPISRLHSLLCPSDTKARFWKWMWNSWELTWETITLAMRPVLMLRPAVLNHSELCRDDTYRFSSHTCSKHHTVLPSSEAKHTIPNPPILFHFVAPIESSLENTTKMLHTVTKGWIKQRGWSPLSLLFPWIS